MVLKVIILVWSLLPFGSTFQVLGADALNDLSPNVTFYRQVGSSRISPLDADRSMIVQVSIVLRRTVCGDNDVSAT